jgi:G3E family GTPase
MERAHTVKTVVVGGFLGAGKTTFVLEQVARSGQRVAVLVNDFGELGVDGELIRVRGGIEVVELPGGCICCTQKSGLLESVQRVAAQLAPDLLIIEPSGVAETSELLQTLSDPCLDSVIEVQAVVAILDALTFLEFSEPDAFGLFFLDQVRSADLILINKADLVPQETLDRIEERVAHLNPGALPLKTSFCRTDAALSPGRSRPRATSSELLHGLGIESLSLVPGLLSEQRLESFLDQVASGSFGRILRGKGFVAVENQGVLNLQIAAGKWVAEELGGQLAPRLTLLGFDLDRERILEFFAPEERP